MKSIALFVLFSIGFISLPLGNYPIDGYESTGIRRLLYLQKVYDGEIQGRKKLRPGQLLPLSSVKLNLTDARGQEINGLPAVDPEFQSKIEGVFKGMSKHYSITAMDITPGRPIRYAAMRESEGYQPGSVGKLVVLAAFFTEISKIYPWEFHGRTNLMKTKQIKAGDWALHDHHTIPVFNVETNEYHSRKVVASDVFSLYEWVDHMVSPSNNGAASVVWRETLLMNHFGVKYPDLTFEEGEEFFKNTPKSELADMAINVVNQPLRDLGITHDEWRLGSFFTGGGRGHIPRKGGSIGSPIGLMKYMVALEQGKIVDPETSLEMKRLLFMTGRRIRYAYSPKLDDAAVYFKSGSLYKCKDGSSCGQYMGDYWNYMNSVAIVEHPEGSTYMVCLMSNVLGKNSAWDHQDLAGKIDEIFEDY